MNDDEAIRHLENSGRYRVIQRLDPQNHYCQGQPTTARTGVVIDTETTGLDTSKDKIIELGLIAFEYDAGSGLIYRILHSYNGFEDPQEPLSDIVKQITGITDDMLSGEHLDDEQIRSWLEKADLIIAHNAAFDRQIVERRFPGFENANWACTMNDVCWQDEDISSFKLDYIAFRLGYFFDGHRAINDARATLHLLTRPLPTSGKLAMAGLLSAARVESHRLFAVDAPFDKKDDLKARGYQWLADFGYSDRHGKPRKGVWSTVVPAATIEAEQQWLTDTVYQGKRDRYIAKVITARERYSAREFSAG